MGSERGPDKRQRRSGEAGLFDPASGENLTHGRGTEARSLASA
jgi:hypothetical protein